MITNVRTFLRDFTTCKKAKARKSETVRVQDKKGELVFSAAGSRKSLLDAARSKIAFHRDLTQPTLSNDRWKPSL